MVWKKAIKTLHFLLHLSVHIGRDPAGVPSPAVVIFPLRCATFCCGIAGMVAFAQGKPEGSARSDRIMEEAFAAARSYNLSSLLAGTFPVQAYLNGEDSLRAMENALDELKRDVVYEEIFTDPERTSRLAAVVEDLKNLLTAEETAMNEAAGMFSSRDLELINSRLTVLRDIVWGLEKDVLDSAADVARLGGVERLSDFAGSALPRYKRLNFLLNCLDRLEVRGRDSAGIQINITLQNGKVYREVISRIEAKGMGGELGARTRPGDLMNTSISLPARDEVDEENPVTVSFTYKTFSVIGALGKNVRELRRAIAADGILREFVTTPDGNDTLMAHTRWASVGSITEENCHPVNNFTLTEAAGMKHFPRYGWGRWDIAVVLNGDIDNYAALRRVIEVDGERIAPEITTDTKIIPLMIEEHLRKGCDLTEAFRRAVFSFEGSHAVAMTSNCEPGRVFLALKGSGQAMYVGFTPDAYLFSSELYGLVEGTSLFIKMDGEKASPASPDVHGQIFVLDGKRRVVSAIEAYYYDGTPIALTEASVQKAEITTRDIDRRDYPHFFLKEISESPRSVFKTLQGKYRIDAEDKVHFNLGEDVLPSQIRESLIMERINRIVIIGHGTAAVAGMAVADGMERYLKGRMRKVEARIASELSGFMVEDGLEDCLVIPISQSGTTTDTNRAVTMAGERGAAIIAIVNRRQSDITTKSHGVFYTSDGRDIEMSVASTKAFYSQIVAGHLLGLNIAQLLGTMSDRLIARELRNLEYAPHFMNAVLNRKEEIEASVRLLAKSKRYWAVVGSGPNKAAADEIRIKLSELCYKTISSDVIENKKHIDLSAEPLIIVCAAGNPEAVMGDILKDVAIFKAHRAAVIVFADEGEGRFTGVADVVIHVPRAAPPLPVILNTMAGHLWGYYAARGIDEDAVFLREFRNRLSLQAMDTGRQSATFYEKIADREFRKMVRFFTTELNERRALGAFSFTTVNTFSELMLLLKYAMGKIPLEDFWQDFREETLSPVDRLDLCLGQAIDELTRPIDAIRHQAKTVTVGTSRKEQFPGGTIFSLLEELRFAPKRITTKNILAIKNIQPAVGAVRGYTLYDINNLDADGNPTDVSTISIAARGGVSLSMTSRTEKSRLLVGTKKTIVSMGHVHIGKGKYDGAPIVVVPILGERGAVRHLLLIHIDYNENLSPAEKIAVLGYKYNDIRNLIQEFNLPWDDAYLADIPVADLFSEPVESLAGRIKAVLNGNRVPQSSTPEMNP